MTKAPYAECAESREMCAACGGKCCQNGAGKAWPSDFKPDVEVGVRAALATGRWEIVKFWGSPKLGFYLRPRMTYDYDGPGADRFCTFWHSILGCELPYAKRPRECRLLEAAGGENGECKGHTGGVTALRRAWRPYRDMLKAEFERQEG